MAWSGGRSKGNRPDDIPTRFKLTHYPEPQAHDKYRNKPVKSGGNKKRPIVALVERGAQRA